MRLEAAVLDTSALLAILGVLPIEPPDVASALAADASLVDVVAVLRSFHDGRTSDVLGDLAILGPMVARWVPTHRLAGTLAELAVDHADEVVADLAAVAAAKTLNLPLVTGQPDLVNLDPDVATVVLRRTPPST
jgi:hypothetical protein